MDKKERTPEWPDTDLMGDTLKLAGYAIVFYGMSLGLDAFTVLQHLERIHQMQEALDTSAFAVSKPER